MAWIMRARTSQKSTLFSPRPIHCCPPRGFSPIVSRDPTTDGRYLNTEGIEAGALLVCTKRYRYWSSLVQGSKELVRVRTLDRAGLCKERTGYGQPGTLRRGIRTEFARLLRSAWNLPGYDAGWRGGLRSLAAWRLKALARSSPSYPMGWDGNHDTRCITARPSAASPPPPAVR